MTSRWAPSRLDNVQSALRHILIVVVTTTLLTQHPLQPENPIQIMHQKQTKAFLHDGKPDEYYKYGLHPPSFQLSGAVRIFDGTSVLTLLMLALAQVLRTGHTPGCAQGRADTYGAFRVPLSDPARITSAFLQGHSTVQSRRRQRTGSDVRNVLRDRANTWSASKMRISRRRTATPNLKRTSFCRPRRSGRNPRN